MFENLKNFFRGLLNKGEYLKTEQEQIEQVSYHSEYQNVYDFNLTAIVANKLANITVSESAIEVSAPQNSGNTANNKRAEYLNSSLQQFHNNLRLITTRAFGVGGIVLKPYIVDKKIYTDVIHQDSYFVKRRSGEIVKEADIIVDMIKNKNDIYTRIENHNLDENGTYTITQRAEKNGKPCMLSVIPEWAGIAPEVKINGAEKMLFAFLKSPVDNRKDYKSLHGVPITYGNQKLIKMINDILDEIPKEYLNKRAFVGADDSLFKDERLPANGLYKLIKGGGANIDSQPFWEIFSPEIRHTAYLDGLDYLFGLLEKSMALNKGILTELSTANATATAIKRSTSDTYATVDAMRKNIEIAIGDLVYSYNLLADYFNLAPKGQYEIKFDWSYGLLEDSVETYTQLKEGMAEGVIKPEELRAFITDEDLETAIKNLPDLTESRNM